jgi:hypothetical protein
LRRIGALRIGRNRRINPMQLGRLDEQPPCSSLVPLIFPALMARKIVVLFKPQAAAASAKL